MCVYPCERLRWDSRLLKCSLGVSFSTAGAETAVFICPGLMGKGCSTSGVCWRLSLWLIPDITSLTPFPSPLPSLPPYHPFPFLTSTSPLGPTTLPSLIFPSHPFLLPFPSPHLPYLLPLPLPQSWWQKSSSFTSPRWWRCTIMSLPTLCSRSSATGVT